MFALSMLHNWKEAVDKKYLGALLIELLKEFDWISNDLLIVKLNGYILSLSTIKTNQCNKTLPSKSKTKHRI